MNHLLFYVLAKLQLVTEREGAGSDFLDFLPSLFRSYFCSIWRGSALLVRASPALQVSRGRP